MRFLARLFYRVVLRSSFIAQGLLLVLLLLLSASEARAQGGYQDVAPSADDGSEGAEGEGTESAKPSSAVPPPPVPAPLSENGQEGDAVDGEKEDPNASSGQAAAEVKVAPRAGDVEPAFKLHAIAAGAKAIGGYQAREFGFGASGIGAIEWGPTPTWGITLETGIVYLASTKREPPEGLEELDGGAGAHLAAGLRIRPMAKSKVAPHPGGLWLSGAAGVGFTARKLAPVFDFFLGYDFVLDESMSIGPTVGYMQVVQTDKSGPRTDSANMILLGVHGTFDFGVKEPKILDRDGDGIPDSVDKCPDHPEDKDGFQDEDGCPDPDNDQDGIPDLVDRCPLDPEDYDGFEDEDGCPDPDNDKDGIPDVSDQCPMEPEDHDGFEDEDGCPDPDNDQDGIPDVKDLCPNEPETWNGIADNDGCPDEEHVRVVGDKIELDQKIHFWTNSDRIRAMSYPVLNKLAQFLINHPEYIQVDIEGHADERGDEAFNVDLSKRRAASILEFLASKGVERQRLKSEGYGSSKPLVEGKTEHAWFMNRRVEFVVTRNRVIKVDPTTGQQVGTPSESAPPVLGKDKGESTP